MDAVPPSQSSIRLGQRLLARHRPPASRRQHGAADSRARRHAATRTARNRFARIVHGAASRYLGSDPLLAGRVVLLAVLIGAISHARSETPWQAVRGADLYATLAGHELADGVHYAYELRADGTFTGFSMGKEVDGTWRLAGDAFCWKSAKRGAEEECLAVERRGTSLPLSARRVRSLRRNGDAG